MFQIFHFLQCDMVLGILNPHSWIFHAISIEKRCLISMPFLSTYIDVRTVNFFPPAESWLVNLNFPCASRMQGGFKIKKEKCHFRFVERSFLAAINCTGSAEGALVPVLLRITHSSLWKREIAWERSRAASGYGVIWGDADRNKQGGIWCGIS